MCLLIDLARKNLAAIKDASLRAVVSNSNSSDSTSFATSASHNGTSDSLRVFDIILTSLSWFDNREIWGFIGVFILLLLTISAAYICFSL